MSNLLRTQERIAELFGVFAFQAKGYSSSGKTDFHKVSEDVLVPIFKQSFNLPRLRNLNSTEKSNFPAIDLADDEAKIAFQITATSESKKIKDTLTKFVERGFYNNYSRLIFYILTEKKNSYPQKEFA